MAPPTSPPGDITALLPAWGRGEQSALDKLLPVVHGELHRWITRVPEVR